MYQRIFVPVDDSATSRYALGEALRLAKLTQATVRLVHVVDLAQFSWSGASFLRTEELALSSTDTAKAVFERTEPTFAEYYDAQAEPTVLEAVGEKVASLLVSKISDWQCDLVVMGTHGFSGVKHLLMGSVAQDVIRQAGIPVLILRVAAS
mgnify:CR=1 FL=1